MAEYAAGIEELEIAAIGLPDMVDGGDVYDVVDDVDDVYDDVSEVALTIPLVEDEEALALVCAVVETGTAVPPEADICDSLVFWFTYTNISRMVLFQ